MPSAAYRAHGVLAGVLSVAVVALVPALAAQRAPPDFAPNPGVAWVIMSRTFLPPQSGPGPVMQDPKHSGASNDDFRTTGAQVNFPIADLSNPILRPWVAEKLKEHNEQVLAGKPTFAARAKCLPSGVPGFLLDAIMPIYIVQSPKLVTMTYQADAQVRRIYLTAKHSANVKPSWYGESIGRYEGDTLVVDTIGLDPRTPIDDFETPHTKQLHVIERFHMFDNGMTLEVNVHVEDPGAFTTPWNAIQRFHRVEPGRAENRDPFNAVLSSTAAGPMLEASCAENPRAGEGDSPIPRADKPDF
jgi:hypothetical protein